MRCAITRTGATLRSWVISFMQEVLPEKFYEKRKWTMAIRQYSLMADGNRSLAPDFKVRELRCRS